MRPGTLGKIERKFFKKIERYLPLKPRPSYKGKVQEKQSVLKKTKFSICYENVSELQGYITEKIFDSFFSGCVPIYWGASNITDYIPSCCFIDRRNFRNTSDMFSFLQSITENQFIDYQKNIEIFLQSESAYQFGADYFTDTVINTVMSEVLDAE